MEKTAKRNVFPFKPPQKASGPINPLMKKQKTLMDALAAGRATGAKNSAISASAYFREITGYAGPLSVEEVEFDQKKGLWSITLGSLENPDAALITGFQNKAYKIFDVKNGQVVSMKVRKF